MTDQEKELHERCRYGLSDPTTFEHILREYDALRKKTNQCPFCRFKGTCEWEEILLLKICLVNFGCNHWEAKQ